MSQPEWMKGFVPTPAPPGGRWQKGQSGNPKGRPPGIVDKRQKLQNAFADEAADIARVVIDKALGGDMQAAKRASPLRFARRRSGSSSSWTPSARCPSRPVKFCKPSLTGRWTRKPARP